MCYGWDFFIGRTLQNRDCKGAPTRLKFIEKRLTQKKTLLSPVAMITLSLEMTKEHSFVNLPAA